MQRIRFTVDPLANDPGRWGHSLINLAEVIIPCLDAVAPRFIVEVGAYAGDVTRLLVEWAAECGARVASIDPSPQAALIELAHQRPELELVQATSLDALRRIAPPDVAIVDGDHNYYTVAEELRLIADLAAQAGRTLPLVMCHDACWPHARRDNYFAPELIPEAERQPTVEGGGVFPGDSGIRAGGLPYRWPARREGGPRNGVLTAIEDFVAQRSDLRLAVVPAFFGLAVVWAAEAPWAAAIDEILAPWGANPVLERLEANRVLHLASWHRQYAEAAALQELNARKDELLRRLLESGTFSVAVALSRLRQRGAPAFSKDEVRRLLSGRR